MAVHASPDTNLTMSVIEDPVDLRTDHSVRVGALAWDSPDIVTGWHRHPYHQLEYALSGVAEVDTDSGRYLLPPQQAIWIPAGVRHNTTLRGVSSVSVFYDPDHSETGGDQARVIAVAPVVREMIHYATRWPITRSGDADPLAGPFFGTLSGLINELLDDPLPFSLPAPEDPVVTAIVGMTLENIASPDLPAMCRSAGVSERTLRRRIMRDTGMTWAGYLAQARLMRAMTLLAGTNRTVIDIATSVGFASSSGFNRAFRRLTGTNPANYRSRRQADP